ncbi:hypothetical protein Moror_11329 [Moniliophthora roreri MCA 2997]|uniref:Uncharacterized protein n=1 Tax=Moniliophthora roreri (strain MCA 2997) TaxID=1381753 RepID=V2WYM0_MONRO|nr:hypothetical protein Moror_11329 [Moniliophthora roreri MCA 2997]
MSLPPAPKDVSAHPTKGSVTDPVNKAAKDADVDRKLNLYTAILALRSSKLPTNAQLDSWFSHALSHSPVPTEKLSKEGQRMIQDVKDILGTLRLMVKRKNSDELIQEWIWSTRQVEVGSFLRSRINFWIVVPVEKDKAKADADQTIQHVRTLLHLLLTNSEARKLVTDFSIIGRDLLSKGLVKASEGIAPGEDRLRGVDEAHKGDQFIPGETKEEQLKREKDTKGATGMVKARLPGEEPTPTGDPAKDQAQAVATDPSPEGVAGLKKQAKAETGATGDVATTDEAKVEAKTAGEEAQKKGLIGRMFGGMKDGISSNIPQEHQDKARQHYTRGKEFLTEEYFPSERRDQFIFRLKKVVVECQKHPDYQEALEWLISYIKEYASHGRTIASSHANTAGSSVGGNPKLQETLSQLGVILERFANGKSLERCVWDPINALIDDGKRDEELRAWWKKVGDWAEKIVREPGYVLEDQCERRGRELIDEGRVFYGSGKADSPTDEVPGSTILGTPAVVGVDGEVQENKRKIQEKNKGMRGKYRDHFDLVFDGIGDWLKGITEDDINRRLGTDVQRFTKDLLFSDDGEGHLKFKKPLWNDVRSVILPVLIEKVGYIPIPRIEYTDESFDLVVENLTLSGRNLFPNTVEIETHNWVKFSPYPNINKTNRHEFILTMGQIQADLRDVAFYFRKKSGAIKIRDSGLADVVLGGEGMTVTVHLTNTSDPATLFAVKTVNVKLDTLKFSIRDSKHDVLYKTLKPIMMGLVKKQIQKAVSDGVESGLGWIGEELVAVRSRMEEARRSTVSGEESEGEQIGKIKAMQEAFKRKRDDTASTSGTSVSMSPSSSSHSTFKVVSNKRDSILAKEGNPAGWVNRSAEKEKLIEKGDGPEGWRSNAFDVLVHDSHHKTATV